MSDRIESQMWTLASRHNKKPAEAAAAFREKLVELLAEIDKNPNLFMSGICLAAIETTEDGEKVGTELHGGIAGTPTAIGALDYILERQLEEPRKLLLEQRLKAQMVMERLEEAKNDGMGKILGAIVDRMSDQCDCAGCVENRRQEEAEKTKH